MLDTFDDVMEEYKDRIKKRHLSPSRLHQAFSLRYLDNSK